MFARLLLATTFLITATENGFSASAFEEMLSGFPECQFHNVYVDIITKEPEHEYFRKNKLKYHNIENDLAYFRIKEKFHTLDVYMIAIPASTFDIHAIYFDHPIEFSSKILKRNLDMIFQSLISQMQVKLPYYSLIQKT